MMKINTIISTILLLCLSVSAFSQENYISLSTREYSESPVIIKNAFIRDDNGSGLRAYFDIEYQNTSNISIYTIWLTLYFEGDDYPQLYEYKNSPNGSSHVIWDIDSDGKQPLSGMLVPYSVEMKNGANWNLKDFYSMGADLDNSGNTPAGNTRRPGRGRIDPPSPAERSEMLRESNSNNASVPHPEWDREMNAVQTSQKIQIDGRLDDEEWGNAEFHSDFLQREPEEGIPATERTEVAVIYDDKNLYIGARLYDSEPDKIAATEMRRDAMVWDDDYFDLVLDTFNDKRSGFYFTTNPLGVRIDGVFNDEGRNNNRDWDGVWMCKTSKDDQGWYVEMAIPWQTLRFREGDNITWGANFHRKIMRKNESDYWRLVPREAGMFGSYRVSQAGRINGFNGLKAGGKFELLPYTSGWIQRDDNLEDEKGEAGIDVKWNVSSNMTADFTYNTDFAQVEADQERVNNTRFSLFFPEKRDFFLEGAETFNFGQGGGGGFGGRSRGGNIQIFHSRRVGIEEGYPIPIIGGSRLYGKAGDYTYGFMSIQTDQHIEPPDLDDDDEENDEGYVIPESNYSVFRLKKDVFSRSSIGLMVLNKEKMGIDDYNRSWGIDTNFPITQTFSFYAVGAGTYSPGEYKNNLAGNAGFNYSSDLWQYSLSYLDIEEDFYPEIGYVRRTDIRRTGARLSYSPRPERFESIRKFNYQVRGNYQTNHENRVLDRQVSSEFRIEFESTARFSINVERQVEFIEEEWSVRDGHTISAGEYLTTGFRTSYSTPRTKALSGTFSLDGGDFYDGSQLGGNLRGELKLFDRFIGSFSHDYTHISLPSGDFHTNISYIRLNYSFNPDMFVKAYLQWYADTIQNYGKNKFLANVLLRYIYRPGSDFYLVFNQENLFGPNDDLQSDLLSNRSIIAKFTYFFRK
ncbi:DUF5916 domain-containing protein [candidate division KSB1 bacterium]